MRPKHQSSPLSPVGAEAKLLGQAEHNKILCSVTEIVSVSAAWMIQKSEEKMYMNKQNTKK
jgi:hypothetical protein